MFKNRDTRPTECGPCKELLITILLKTQTAFDRLTAKTQFGLQ